MNHWKTVILGLAVVVITGVATGLVLARWYGPEIARLDVPRASPATAPSTLQTPQAR